MDITFVFYLVNMKNSMAMKCVSLVVCFVLTSYVTGASVEEGTICKGIDVRNVVESFSQLENCTVIEGSLSILLIEGATQEKYQALSFPNLREITDYLLLYRVYGLKTLSNIFPNLSVIRGQKLFYNFALVAFEMMDLEELGLIGLTVIERGAVRLEKNHQLCYIDTIDWTRIAIGVDRKDHYIHGNKIPSECIDICSKQCQSTPKSDFENNKMIPRCWTLQYCQLNLEKSLKFISNSESVVNFTKSTTIVKSIFSVERSKGNALRRQHLRCILYLRLFVKSTPEP